MLRDSMTPISEPRPSVGEGGTGTIETVTVTAERDGANSLAILSCRSRSMVGTLPSRSRKVRLLGGRFARADQPLIEFFRLISIGAETPTLRIVDLDDNDGVFPCHLVATHLCVAAGASRRDALRLLLVSLEVWPKEKVASNAALGDYELNTNNFRSWIDLGTIFSETGRIDDAISHWKTAVCMWPRGGKQYAGRIIERGSPNPHSGASSRAVHDFWQSVTNDAIRNWSAELGVELPESALAD